MLKIYSKDIKYRGGDDSLNRKLQIFYNLYLKASVPPKLYSNAFLIMLKGDACDYYYNKISSYNLNFTTMVKTTQEHFKIEEHH